MSELIAEARVLVTPDTTTFRALLTAELTAITKGIPPVPVTVAPVVSGAAATAGISELAAAEASLTAIQNQQIGAQSRLTTVSAERTRAARLQAAAVTQLAAVEEAGATASSATALAQLKATAAQAALTTARRAEAALTRADTAETAHNTVVTLQNAEALAADTQAALANARAHQTRAAALAQSSRGAASAALSFLGLRGATLAAGGAFLAGAAAIVSFGRALSSAATFETSLATFQVTADATATDMERISETAKALGRDLTLPGVTAQSAADALSGLARAGLDVENAVGGVRGTLQLATAAAIDNEQAVTLVANALNAFKLEGTEATRVADLFAAASKESQGSIVDVGLAFQQSAAAAAQAGVSVEDTIALLTQLGRAGLRGSDAGTSLRVALLRLINPSKKAREEIERLGIEVRDLQGNVRPEAFAEFTEQLSGLSRAQQDATLAMIFGQDAFRAAAILGREGARGLDETREATQEAGAAAELAGARAQGLAGAWENLKNQGESLGLTIGQTLAGPTELFVDIVAGGLKNINDFNALLAGTGPIAETTSEKIREANSAFADLVVKAGEANAALARRAERGSGGGFIGDTLPDDVKDLNTQLAETQSEGLKTRDVIEGLRASFDAAAGAAEGLTNRLDESFDRAASAPTEIAGPRGPKALGPTAKLDVRAQIAASNEDLRELERIQEIQLENARKAFENSRGNVKQREALFLEMGAAEARLNSTRRQIASQAEADAKKTAEDIARKNREADQDLLAAQGRAESTQQNQIAKAQRDEALANDIRETRDLKQLYLAQRKTLQERIKDLDTRKQAVAALTKKIVDTESDIAELVKQQQQARADAQQKALDAITENLALRTQIAEARGDEDAVLVALNNEIANQRKRVAAAKKAGKGFLQERLALEQMLQKRRELLEGVEAASGTVGGRSLADLFKEAQDIAAGAGNVGFTAQGLRDLPANQRIATEVQQRLDIVNDPAARAQKDTTDAIGRLIASIDRLNENISGGNTTTGGVTAGMNGRGFQWSALTQEQRFFYQKQAKAMVDHGLQGRGGI